MTPQPQPATAGILIALDVLIVQRSDEPHALEEAPLALRRIGWMGRPIILVGRQVAGRDLPADPRDREAWVRAALGPGAYTVVPFNEPLSPRAPEDDLVVAAWRALVEKQGASWLVTLRARQVGAARQAGLRSIVVGPQDPQPLVHRPDYQARDLRDAVGHLLGADVFSADSAVSIFQ